MKTKIVLAIVLFSAFFAQAGVRKFHVCAALLSTLSRVSPTIELRERSTEDAIKTMQAFRLELLGETSASAELAAVSSSSEALRPAVQRVARRIKSIELKYDQRNAATEDKLFISGLHLSGKEEIESFNNQISEFAHENLSLQFAKFDERELIQLSMSAVMAPLWPLLYLIVRHDPSFLTTLGLLPVFMLMLTPDTLVRHALSYGRTPFANINALTPSIQPAERIWRYDSKQFRVTADLWRELSSNGRATTATLKNQACFCNSSQGEGLTYRLLGKPWRYVYLDVDQLMFINPLTQTPEYVLTARVSEKRPRLPKTSTVSITSPAYNRAALQAAGSESFAH